MFNVEIYEDNVKVCMFVEYHELYQDLHFCKILFCGTII